MHLAPSRLRDREAYIRAALTPWQATLDDDGLQRHSKACFLTARLVWTLLFFAVVGIFTALHPNQFSHLLISILDVATLALLAASPIILGKPTRPFVLHTLTELL